MPFLFGGGGGGAQHQTSTAQRRPGGQWKQLIDLLTRASTSQILHPPETPLSVPLRQGVGGLQSILPQLFSDAFGNGGIAGMLTGAPEGSAPTFGAAPTKEDLGIPPPTSAMEGFLPPTEDVQRNLPPVRQSGLSKKRTKLERRVENAKTPAQQAARGAKLDRFSRRPGFLPTG